MCNLSQKRKLNFKKKKTVGKNTRYMYVMTAQTPIIGRLW